MPELSLFVDNAEKNPDWDLFLQNAKHGHFIQSSFWAVVKRTQGWKTLRFILKSVDGSICAGAQVLYKQYFGFICLIQLVYGPVCAEGHQDYAFRVLDEINIFSTIVYFSCISSLLKRTGIYLNCLIPLATCQAIRETWNQRLL